MTRLRTVRTRRLAWALPVLLALTLSVAACDGAITSIVERDPPAPDGGVQAVVPVPGQVDVHPVTIDRSIAEVADRHVTVTAFFTTGVEPCHVLDSVVVQRGAGTIAITLIEGRSGRDVACPSVAVTKSTAIDLGDLDPGSYRITDSGHAPTVDIVVD